MTARPLHACVPAVRPSVGLAGSISISMTPCDHARTRTRRVVYSCSASAPPVFIPSSGVGVVDRRLRRARGFLGFFVALALGVVVVVF